MDRRYLFIKYIYYRNMQFLNNVIINKNKGSPPSGISDFNRYWLFYIIILY